LSAYPYSIVSKGIRTNTYEVRNTWSELPLRLCRRTTSVAYCYRTHALRCTQLRGDTPCGRQAKTVTPPSAVRVTMGPSREWYVRQVMWVYIGNETAWNGTNQMNHSMTGTIQSQSSVVHPILRRGNSEQLELSETYLKNVSLRISHHEIWSTINRETLTEIFISYICDYVRSLFHWDVLLFSIDKGECLIFLWSICGSRMASVMPKCYGMDRFALVLRMRPCDVDEVSSGSWIDHEGMSQGLIQQGRPWLSCWLPYNWCGVSSVRTGGQCEQSLWPTAWNVRRAASRKRNETCCWTASSYSRHYWSRSAICWQLSYFAACAGLACSVATNRHYVPYRSSPPILFCIIAV
jgi:hypothetical protein